MYMFFKCYRYILVVYVEYFVEYFLKIPRVKYYAEYISLEFFY